MSAEIASIRDAIESTKGVRLDFGTAFSASKGILRTVSVYKPGEKTPAFKNLSIEGGDESVAAFLRALADLLEASKS